MSNKHERVFSENFCAALSNVEGPQGGIYLHTKSRTLIRFFAGRFRFCLSQIKQEANTDYYFK